MAPEEPTAEVVDRVAAAAPASCKAEETPTTHLSSDGGSEHHPEAVCKDDGGGGGGGEEEKEKKKEEEPCLPESPVLPEEVVAPPSPPEAKEEEPRQPESPACATDAAPDATPQQDKTTQAGSALDDSASKGKPARLTAILRRISRKKPSAECRTPEDAGAQQPRATSASPPDTPVTPAASGTPVAADPSSPVAEEQPKKPKRGGGFWRLSERKPKGTPVRGEEESKVGGAGKKTPAGPSVEIATGEEVPEAAVAAASAAATTAAAAASSDARDAKAALQETEATAAAAAAAASSDAQGAEAAHQEAEAPPREVPEEQREVKEGAQQQPAEQMPVSAYATIIALFERIFSHVRRSEASMQQQQQQPPVSKPQPDRSGVASNGDVAQQPPQQQQQETNGVASNGEVAQQPPQQQPDDKHAATPPKPTKRLILPRLQFRKSRKLQVQLPAH